MRDGHACGAVRPSQGAAGRKGAGARLSTPVGCPSARHSYHLVCMAEHVMLVWLDV